MKKIAVLVSDNLLPDFPDGRADAFELHEQMDKLVPAFADFGLQLDTVRWREASSRAPDYDAMLPLFVWDYFEGNQQAFLSEMARAEQHTRLLNRFNVLAWNSDKSYLDEFDRSGAPVIRSMTLERVTKTGIERAFDTFQCEEIVIKPVVGGGAWRQVLHKKGDPFPEKNELPPEGAMVQPFLPSVQEEGEYSFVYFGGAFSHALVKHPKAGDYRIQSIYGGKETSYTPTSAERTTAREILDTLDFTPLYARVDLLRGRDGSLKLIELEMIEPYLYLAHSEGDGAQNKGARRLAEALVKKLES